MNTETWKAESTKDSILDGIDFQDIILMLQCNIPKERHRKAEVIKAYKELLATRLEDAEFILDKNIDFILKNASNSSEVWSIPTNPMYSERYALRWCHREIRKAVNTMYIKDTLRHITTGETMIIMYPIGECKKYNGHPFELVSSNNATQCEFNEYIKEYYYGDIEFFNICNEFIGVNKDKEASL